MRTSAIDHSRGPRTNQARAPPSGAVFLGRGVGLSSTVKALQSPLFLIFSFSDSPTTPASYSLRQTHLSHLPRPNSRPRPDSHAARIWYGHHNPRASKQLQPTSAHRLPHCRLPVPCASLCCCCSCEDRAAGESESLYCSAVLVRALP